MALDGVGMGDHPLIHSSYHKTQEKTEFPGLWEKTGYTSLWEFTETDTVALKGIIRFLYTVNFHILERGKKRLLLSLFPTLCGKGGCEALLSPAEGGSVTCYQDVVPPGRAERQRTLRVKSKLQGVVTPASELPVNITVLKNTFPSRKTQHTVTEAHLGQDIFRAFITQPVLVKKLWCLTF